MAEMVAPMVVPAVAVPMTEVMAGEMMPEVVVMGIVMQTVIKAVPIKTMKATAAKSVTEGRPERAMRPAAAAARHRVGLSQCDGEQQSRGDREELSQKRRCHSQAP
jgi:hypothetical protein